MFRANIFERGAEMVMALLPSGLEAIWRVQFRLIALALKIETYPRNVALGLVLQAS